MRAGAVAALWVGGAAVIGASTLVGWVDSAYHDDLRGSVISTISGSAVVPASGPIAGATLAAVGALLATRGSARRAVGALVVVLGAVVAGLAVRILMVGQLADVVDTESSTAQLTLRPLGPALALAGAAPLIVGGLAVLSGRITSGVLSARHERLQAPAEQDRELALWKELDAHRDPTALDPTADDPQRHGGSIDDEPSR